MTTSTRPSCGGVDWLIEPCKASWNGVGGDRLSGAASGRASRSQGVASDEVRRRSGALRPAGLCRSRVPPARTPAIGTTAAAARCRSRGSRPLQRDAREHGQGDRDQAQRTPRTPEPPGASVAAGAESVQRARPATRRTRASARRATSASRFGAGDKLVDNEREQEVEGDRSEPEPDRPVGREERHDRVLQSDRRVAVDDRRHHVDADERDRQQREVAVASS